MFELFKRRREQEEANLESSKNARENLTHEDHTDYDAVAEPGSEFDAANQAYLNKDYDKAVELYLKINDPEATLAAGNVQFYQGKYEESYKNIQKSADEGCGGAYGGVAKCFREGLGVETDYNKNKEYTLKGADDGDVICMFLAGSNYMMGTFGFEQDIQEGSVYLAKAQIFGCKYSETMLAEYGIKMSYDGKKIDFHRM